MHRQWMGLGILALALGGAAHGQGPKGAPAAAPVGDEQELAVKQEQLIRLLRVSPTLTEVVERDPSLLANKDYVTRSNPELEQYLEAHPEIAKNPEFYLFSGLPAQRGRRSEALERKVWPEYSQPEYQASPEVEIAREIVPLVVFFCVLGALLWLIHLFVNNRSESRMFKIQMDAHERMMDRFGANSQELLQYMESAGKQSIEAPSMPARLRPDASVPNVVGRVLFSAQVGLILALLGIGLLFLHYHVRDAERGLLVAGIILLMPGVGFILSSAFTWTLAGRLGLLPEKPADSADAV